MAKQNILSHHRQSAGSEQLRRRYNTSVGIAALIAAAGVVSAVVVTKPAANPETKPVSDTRVTYAARSILNLSGSVRQQKGDETYTMANRQSDGRDYSLQVVAAADVKTADRLGLEDIVQVSCAVDDTVDPEQSGVMTLRRDPSSGQWQSYTEKHAVGDDQFCFNAINEVAHQ